MKESKLNKPNELIAVKTDKKLSVIQKKAYNVFLKNAQQFIKFNDLDVSEDSSYNFEIDCNTLHEIAGIKKKDLIYIEKDLELLMGVIVTIRDKDNPKKWDKFSILPRIKTDEKKYKYMLLGNVVKALKEQDYFTPLNLITIGGLNSQYSVVIYELAIRYNKVKIPKMTIEEIREITGTTDIYTRMEAFKRRVLNPACEEISEKTDISLSYETEKEGKRIAFIKFKITSKNNKISAKENINIKKFEIQEDINPEFENIKNMLQVDPAESDLKIIKKYYDKKGVDYVISNIKYANKRANKVKYYGFLVGRNGALEKDYAVQERKKAKIQKEKESKKKLKEEQKQEFEEFFEKYVFNRYADLEYFETLEYEELFNKNKKFYKSQNVTLETFIISQLKSNYMEQIERACEPDNYEDYKGFLNHLIEMGV